MKYRLIVSQGTYESDSLIKLVCEIVWHRTRHFLAGDGFVD